MSRRRLAPIVCAAASLFAASQANAQFFIGEPMALYYSPEATLCPPPSLEECQSPEYLETACGAEAAARVVAYPDGTPSCRDQLEAMAFERAHTLPGEMRLVPEAFGGGLAETAVTPYSYEGMTYELEGEDTWRGKVASLSARASALGEMPAEMMELRHRYADNGASIETCEEYVYEKYYTLSRFEDEAAPLGADYRAMVELARETLAAAHVELDPSDPGPAIEGFDGTPVEGGEVAMVPRNAYLGAPLDLIASDDRLAHLMPAFEAGDALRPDTLAALLHLDRQLAEIPDELLLKLELPQEAFSDDVARRAELTARLDRLAALEPMGEEGACLGEIDEETGLCDGEALDAEGIAAALEAGRAELEGIHERLVEGLLAAEAQGCLSVEGATPCDVSPRRVVRAITEQRDAEREADYRACKEVEEESEGGLRGLDGLALLNLDGTVMVEGERWLASPGMFDRFLDMKAAAEAARKAEAERIQEEAARAEAKAKAEMSKLGGGVKKPEQRFHKYSKLGNSDFNLYYEYLMRWRVFDFEQVLCNVNAEFEAMFRAGATGFGKAVNLIYVRFFLNLNRYDGQIQIAGKNLYKSSQSLAGNLTFNLVKDSDLGTGFKASAHTYFTVVFIPVKVEGGISGRLGLKYGAKAGIDKGGAQCTHVDAYVKGHVTPYARLNAFAALAVDILVARAGIKGSLEVVNMSLPFKARIALSAPRGDIRALEMVVDTGMSFAFRALSGALSLWGELGWCPACLKGETTIFKWKGPRWNVKVFEHTLKVPLFGLQRLLAQNP